MLTCCFHVLLYESFSRAIPVVRCAFFYALRMRAFYVVCLLAEFTVIFVTRCVCALFLRVVFTCCFYALFFHHVHVLYLRIVFAGCFVISRLKQIFPPSSLLPPPPSSSYGSYVGF